jgi:hypothetical protein
MMIQLRSGGAGMSKALVKEKNDAARGQSALPTGVAALLSGSTSATVQLFGNDAPECISVTLPTIVKDVGVQFKAKK